jgi:hypothetical protein
LYALLGGLCLIECAAVAAALDENRARDQIVAGQCLDGEPERALDEAMNNKLVLSRIDVRNTVMQTLEMQPIRGDRTLQRVQRGAGRSSPDGARQAGEGADHRRLTARGLSIGDEWAARLQHPWRHLHGLRL